MNSNETQENPDVQPNEESVEEKDEKLVEEKDSEPEEDNKPEEDDDDWDGSDDVDDDSGDDVYRREKLRPKPSIFKIPLLPKPTPKIFTPVIAKIEKTEQDEINDMLGLTVGVDGRTRIVPEETSKERMESITGMRDGSFDDITGMYPNEMDEITGMGPGDMEDILGSDDSNKDIDMESITGMGPGEYDKVTGMGPNEVNKITGMGEGEMEKITGMGPDEMEKITGIKGRPASNSKIVSRPKKHKSRKKQDVTTSITGMEAGYMDDII